MLRFCLLLLASFLLSATVASADESFSAVPLPVTKFVVKVRGVSIRQTPASSVVIGLLSLGDKVEVLDETEDSGYIKVRQGSVDGWVLSSSLEKEAPVVQEPGVVSVVDLKIKLLPIETTQPKKPQASRKSLRKKKPSHPGASELELSRLENARLQLQIENMRLTKELAAVAVPQKSAPARRPGVEEAFELVTKSGRDVEITGAGIVRLIEYGRDLVIKTPAESISDVPESLRSLAREIYHVSETSGSYLYLIFPREALRRTQK